MGNKIYAVFEDKTIRVYQAYNDSIADEALKLGTFGKAFRLDRMTWIKPSFMWMMYRSGWATKENQNRILAIDMERSGFDYIVDNAVLSTFYVDIYGTLEAWKKLIQKSEIRCQWDPDRDIYGNPKKQRAIQLGIKGKIVERYLHEWIVKITDITTDVMQMRNLKKAKQLSKSMLPMEVEYPIQ